MGTIVGAGLRYMAMVIGAGFLFGVVRVPFVVPRLGERWAELAEMPFMAVVIFLSAGHVLRRFPLINSSGRALATGCLALVLAVAAELLLAVALQSQTLREYIAGRDRVSGSVYLAMLMVFALMPRLRLPSFARSRAAVAVVILAVLCASGVRTAAQPRASAAQQAGRAIRIETAPVPLNPRNPWEVRLGDFVYAGGLALTSTETDQLHGLSDLEVTAANRLTAVSDTGLLVEARLDLDPAGRLTGLSDGRLTTLVAIDGSVPPEKSDMDAEGVALLPNGDRLISFEMHDRVWLYPASGGRPRLMPSPAVAFPANTGLEAITLDPDVAPDAYTVGDEAHGNTWSCRISGGCVKGPPVDLPPGYALVSMRRFRGGHTAYLLRAFDLRRGNRSSLRIYRDGTLAAQLDLALPLTLDNYEGVAAVPRADGSTRFYLVSDDNARAFQRTLLVAFDWTPQ